MHEVKVCKDCGAKAAPWLGFTTSCTKSTTGRHENTKLEIIDDFEAGRLVADGYILMRQRVNISLT